MQRRAFSSRLPVHILATVCVASLLVAGVWGEQTVPSVFQEDMPGTVLRDFQSSYQQLLRVYSLSEEQDREIVDNLKVCFRDLGAWKALLEVGPTGVLSMVRALGLPDAEVRLNAVTALEQVLVRSGVEGINREQWVSLVSRSLYDLNNGVRGAAARILYMHLRVMPDVDLLSGWFDGTDGAAQAAAVEALLLTGHLDSIPWQYLNPWMEHILPCSSLFISPWGTALPPALAKLADEKPLYSADEARAVGELVRELARQPQRTRDGDGTGGQLEPGRVVPVSGFALTYLEGWLRYPVTLPGQPDDASQAPEDAYRLAALRLLGQVADHVDRSQVPAQVVPLLLRSCYDSSTPCVQEALRVLAPLKDPRARTEYERLLHHRAEEVRLQAAAALRQLPQSAN